MEIFTVNNLSFRFPEMKEAVLKDISFHVQEGEFIVLCGPSGCGKTTLLRLLKSQLAPVGECEGVINYNGKQMDQWSDRKLIEEIGYLFQDPENQIVMDEVYEEIDNIQIELYTNKKDLVSEKKVKDVLNKYQLPYETTESFIETEKLFQKIYEVSL